MKIFLIALLGLLQTSTSTFTLAAPAEGGQEGNGGDVVVCPGRSVELLDFYEARALRGIKIEPRAEADYRLILAELLEASRASFPGLVEKLELEIQKFHAESLFLSDVNLTDIPDSRHIALPTGCTIEQIAIQRAPIYPQDKRYTVNADLWSQLAPLDKAGLVLHEVLYKHGLEGGISHSMDVRYLNSILFAGIVGGLNDRDRFQILFNSRQPIFDVVRNGAWLRLPVYRDREVCGGLGGNCRKVAEPLEVIFDKENRISAAFSPAVDREVLFGQVRYENGFQLGFPLEVFVHFLWEEAGLVLSGKERYSLSLRGSYHGYPFVLAGVENGGAEKVCWQNSSYEYNFYSSEHLTLTQKKAGCMSTAALFEISRSTIPYAKLQGLKSISYKLPEDYSLEEFLPAGSGRWEVGGSTAQFTYGGSSLETKGATVRWHHPKGILDFAAGSNIQLTASGDISVRSDAGGYRFAGTWKTSAGFDFVGQFRLREDYTFEQGASDEPLSFKNTYLELGYQELEEGKGFTWFRRLTGGWLQLQGKKLALGSWGPVGIYASGAPSYFMLEESVKLKNTLGKEKLYKGSAKNPFPIYLTEEGLVNEGK